MVNDTKEYVKNEFETNVKTESNNVRTENSSHNEEKTIKSNTDGILKLIEQFDPLICWNTLGKKILSKYSMYDDILERAR